MSQAIKKLAGGGTTSEEKLFKNGNTNLLLDTLVKSLDGNVDNYLKSKNWDEQKRTEFLNEFDQIKKDIANGNIAERELDGNYVDKSGRLNQKNDTTRQVLRFVDQIVLPSDEYKKPEEKKKDVNQSLLDLFGEKYRGGNKTSMTSDDLQIWLDNDSYDKETKTRGTAVRAEKFYNLLQDYRNSLGEDADPKLIQKIDSAMQALQDGEGRYKYDNTVASALLGLGMSGSDINRLFANNIGEEVAEEEKTKEQLEKEAREAKEKEYQQRKKDELTSLWITPAQNWNTSPYRDRYVQLTKGNYDKDAYDRLLGDTSQAFYNGDFLTLFNQYNPLLDNYDPNAIVTDMYHQKGLPASQWLSNHLQAIVDSGVNAGLGQNPDGTYYLPFTASTNDGLITIWDPNYNTLRRVPVRRTAYWQYLLNKYDEDNRLPEYKEGGVLFLQQGGTPWFNGTERNARYGELVKSWEQKGRKQGRSVEDVKKGEETMKLSDAFGSNSTGNVDSRIRTALDLRLATMALDVVSGITSFVPEWGTAASGVASLGSLVTNTIADIKDPSVGLSQGLRNAGMQIGWGIAGLIPGGKFGKIAKDLAKWGPSLMAIYGTVAGSEEALKVIDKAIHNEDITLDEWRQLSHWLTAATGTTRVGTRAYKMKQIKNNASMKEISSSQLQVKTSKGMKDIDRAWFDQHKNDTDFATQFRTKYGADIKADKKYLLFGKPVVKEKTIKGKSEYDFANQTKANEKYGVTGTPTMKLFKNDYDILTGQGNGWWLYRNGNNNTSNSVQPSGISISDKASEMPLMLPQRASQVPQLPYYNVIYLKEGNKLNYIKHLKSLKQGGIIKAQNGIKTVQEAEWRKRPGNLYENTNPVNVGSWNNYYNSDKVINGILSLAKQQTSDQLLKNLNAVETADNGLSWNQKLNDLGYSNWNIAFNNTGFNSIFGYNPEKNNYMGPSTWNRHFYYDKLRKGELGEGNTITTSDGKTIGYNAVKKLWELINPTAQTNENPTANNNENPATSDNLNNNPNEASAGTVENETSASRASAAYDIYNPVQTLKAKIPGPGYLPTADLIQKLGINDLILRTKKSGMQPFMEFAPELYRPIHGDEATRNAYYQKGIDTLNKIILFGKSSDEAINSASRLEAMKYADQMKLQGDIADNQRVYETGLKNAELQDQNKIARTQVANNNRARQIQMIGAKADVDSAYLNVLSTNLSNFTKGWQQKLDRYDIQLKEQQLRNALVKGLSEIKQSDDYRNYEALKKKLEASEYKDNPENWPEYKTLQGYQERINNAWAEKQRHAKASILGLPYEPNYEFVPVIYHKKGGSVTERERIDKMKRHREKLFQRNIEKSVDHSIKMINNLSEVTKKLILSAMGVK